MAIKGGKKHSKRLKALQNASRRIVAGLYEAGQLIEADAERSITQGSISGKGHIPSLPGEPPNADTRFLDTNIETTIEAQSPPKVFVTSKADYSAALEFGTSKMAERPFMRPASNKNKKKVAEKVAAAISITVKSAG